MRLSLARHLIKAGRFTTPSSQSWTVGGLGLTQLEKSRVPPFSSRGVGRRMLLLTSHTQSCCSEQSINISERICLLRHAPPPIVTMEPQPPLGLLIKINQGCCCKNKEVNNSNNSRMLSAQMMGRAVIVFYFLGF